MWRDSGTEAVGPFSYSTGAVKNRSVKLAHNNLIFQVRTEHVKLLFSVE